MQKKSYSFYKWISVIFRIYLVLEFLYNLFNKNIAASIYCIFILIATFWDVIMPKLCIPDWLGVLIQGFIFLSMYLGKLHGYYSKVINWDDYLHISSGIIVAIFALYTLLFINKKLRLNIHSISLITAFMIITSIATAGAWEIFEFSGDTLLGLNSQGGSLNDTMHDIINGTIGGLISSLLFYFKPSIFKIYPLECTNKDELYPV
ncbi:hypothetical protein GCM10008905_21700 [Clostridium malenominatum]|uniref:Membrane-spanning protein n=1 Tax=Clostridium malenominatum TaxID=1539 RepID=A0ABN1J1E8_9CLOT